MADDVDDYREESVYKANAERMRNLGYQLKDVPFGRQTMLRWVNPKDRSGWSLKDQDLGDEFLMNAMFGAIGREQPK